MTTDLTGDFGLGEDEFEWDVFLPDPDDAEIAAEAAALQDEDELDLDDSDFDWEAALREDSEPEVGSDGAARAGAAYDRIVDTVRRSFEEPETEADRPADVHPEPVVVPTTETVAAAQTRWEPELEEPPAATLQWAPEPAATELDEGDEFEPESWLELQEESPSAGEPEAAPWPEANPAPEAAEARIAAMAATVAAVAAVVEAEPTADLEGEPEQLSDTTANQGDTGISATHSSAPAHARKSRRKNAPGDEDRSRVFTAIVVLASAALVVIAVAAVMYALQHANTASPPAQTPPPASSTAATARIQTATDAIDSATTSATVGFSSMGSFPPPSNVEKIVNPYVSSLQLYGTLLSESKVPAAARSDVASAEAQVRQDVQFLDTIDGLPPLQLGAFLKQFDADATQLQTTLSALEQNLRAPAS